MKTTKYVRYIARIIRANGEQFDAEFTDADLAAGWCQRHAKPDDCGWLVLDKFEDCGRGFRIVDGIILN
jgi:hypothetical protein